tara:strand:- start:524 stop:1207 length:684 start_codon:yes stop_codon:yes gene_type:complete
MNKKGILIQGKISYWTKHIIEFYQKKIPDAEILLSTWINEKIDDIACDVIQLEPPKQKEIISSTNVNFIIVGVREGLKKMKSDVIMKCRTDQFIHNYHIFDLFQNCCCKEKIMAPSYGLGVSDYYIADFCQVGYKKILQKYWDNIPLFDSPKSLEMAETYCVKNYIKKVNNDHRDWYTVMDEYFCIKGIHTDFKIEWEKWDTNTAYQENEKRNYKLYYKKAHELNLE